MGATPLPDGTLPAREAYRLWAPRYDEETAVSALEKRLVDGLTPPVVRRSLLDAACGTGRRLPPPGAGWRRAVGVDLVPEMLASGLERRGGEGGDGRRPVLAAGDLRALPFRSGVFDLVWCRLAVGHLPDPAPAYRELARVAGEAAVLVVSDFHPAAVAAGHTRTFRDAAGRLRAVEHHVHTPDDHRRAARAAGWTCERTVEAPAGPEERSYYERAGRAAQFERERELPLVLVMCFRR